MVWRHRYRLNGRTEKLTLGKYPALGVKGARLKRDAAALAVEEGKSPAQQKQLAKITPPKDIPVAEFGERCFREVVAKDRKIPTILRRCFDKCVVEPRRRPDAEGRDPQDVAERIPWPLR